MVKMTSEEIKKLIQKGEKIDVEFKSSKDALTKDIYDSVCSFNNRNGGHICKNQQLVDVTKLENLTAEEHEQFKTNFQAQLLENKIKKFYGDLKIKDNFEAEDLLGNKTKDYEIGRASCRERV